MNGMYNKINIIISVCFISFGIIFNTQAVEPTARIIRKPMRPSPLKTVTAHDENDENNVEIICCPVVIKPDIVYRFPRNYPNITLIADADWRDLPPLERQNWIFDRYTPDKVVFESDSPLSARLKYRMRKEAVRKRFEEYRERIGYGKN